MADDGLIHTPSIVRGMPYGRLEGGARSACASRYHLFPEGAAGMPMAFTIEKLAKLFDISETEVVRIGKILGQSPKDGHQELRDAVSRKGEANLRELAIVLGKEDDLGRIVRAHIHIENELEKYVFAAAPNSSQLK